MPAETGGQKIELRKLADINCTEANLDSSCFMTLIKYFYLPKGIQKVKRGVLFLYKGVVLNGKSH